MCLSYEPLKLEKSERLTYLVAFNIINVLQYVTRITGWCDPMDNLVPFLFQYDRSRKT
jgi:hypothetical protein